MATRKLLSGLRAKVMGTGAELGARVASKAMDAVEVVDRVRHDAPKALRSAARRVPIVGRRLSRQDALKPAIAEVKEQAQKIAQDVKRTTKPRARPMVSDTKIQLEAMPPADYFKGRKVTTSKGRKTIPAAAAKRVQAKAKPNAFKPKRGQKKKHH